MESQKTAVFHVSSGPAFTNYVGAFDSSERKPNVSKVRNANLWLLKESFVFLVLILSKQWLFGSDSVVSKHADTTKDFSTGYFQPLRLYIEDEPIRQIP